MAPGEFASWDGVPLPGLTLADLDTATLKDFRRLAQKSQRLPEAVLEEPDQNLLEKLHLVEGSYLTRAAALLFHPDPERFFTGASVKIGYFESNVNLRYQDEIQGDLFTQVNQTLEVLKAKYLRAWITYEGLQRIETWPVPMPALLLGKHASIPFNPDIASVFFRAGMIEAWGRGIERIMEACRETGTPEPEVRYEQTGLWMVFDFLPEHSAQGARAATEEATEEVERLVLKLEGPMSRVRLQQALGLKHENHFRWTYLTPALRGGLVEMTIPDRPKSGRQQYRLTAKGEELRAKLLKEPGA